MATIFSEHGSGATENVAAGSTPDVNGLAQVIQQMQAEIVRLQTMVGSNVPVDPPAGYSSKSGSNLNSRDFKRVSAFDGDPKQYRDWNQLSTELQSLLSRKD